MRDFVRFVCVAPFFLSVALLLVACIAVGTTAMAVEHALSSLFRLPRMGEGKVASPRGGWNGKFTYLSGGRSTTGSEL